MTRKRKCPNCDETFYVRRNYHSDKKLVIEAERIDELENDNNTYFQYISDVNWTIDKAWRLGATDKDYLEIISLSPNRRMHDVLWRLCNEKALKHFSEMQMGFYTRIRYEMATILEREERHLAALKMYLAVFYLEANGPRNTAMPLTDEFPPFSKQNIFIVPRLIVDIEDHSEKLNISYEELKSLFFQSIETGYETLLITTPEQAWEMSWKNLKNVNNY